MLDEDGFRANVGIVLANQQRQIFWGKRIGQDAWQFPQGGVHEGETPEETLYRELNEEIGVEKDCVTHHHLHSRLATLQTPPLYAAVPKEILLLLANKQKWYLLELTAGDDSIKLDKHDSPEFDQWRWVNYWYPLRYVISFKKTCLSQSIA